MTRRQRIILFIGAIVLLHTAIFAKLPQSSSQTGAGTGRIYTLYGDVKMFELDGPAPPNTLFDLILYTRGNDAFARQRVGKGGRYRFNNIPEGNYFIAVELNNVELARVAMHVAQRKGESIRQDLELEWTSDLRNRIGVGPALNSYTRGNQNRALYERAMKEINKNDLVKAMATLRSIVEADPKDFPAWNELGKAYFIQRDFAAAENSYGKVIELKPDYVTAFVSLGRVRLEQKKNEGAVKILEEALKADPKSAIVNYFLGEAYLAQKKGSLAIGYLNEAIKLDPIAMANAHLRIATLYHLAGYKDRAAIEYNEFLKKRPNYPEAQRLREYIIANNPRTKRKPSPSPSPSPNP